MLDQPARFRSCRSSRLSIIRLNQNSRWFQELRTRCASEFSRPCPSRWLPDECIWNPSRSPTWRAPRRRNQSHRQQNARRQSSTIRPARKAARLARTLPVPKRGLPESPHRPSRTDSEGPGWQPRTSLFVVHVRLQCLRIARACRLDYRYAQCPRLGCQKSITELFPKDQPDSILSHSRFVRPRI